MVRLPVLERELSPASASAVRASVLASIQQRLNDAGATLADAIRKRDLYFRVSVIGSCNLSCAFCHNEGAPTRGKMTVDHALRAVTAAAQIGFRRVQFTGGEPLLHPNIGQFVASARTVVDDVGVTTNGTYLIDKLPALLEGGIQRIHISLQTESLAEAGQGGSWGIPDWLAPALQYASEGRYFLRLNLPVPADSLPAAEDFLELLIPRSCDIQAFSILPEGETAQVPFPITELEALVARANQRRQELGARGRVLLRGFRPPTGIRCASCFDRDRCKEQSHSLRLGSDGNLRPCLATRSWDSALSDELVESLREAALLALDYSWPELESAGAR